ncbi:MAG: hypothetical protein ACOC1L_06945 [Bacillota bacterium]
MSNTKILVVIVKHGQAKHLIDLLDPTHFENVTVVKGEGTVNPMLYASMVNLNQDVKRDILILQVNSTYLSDVQALLKNEARLDKKHTGIMFTIPLTDLVSAKKED